MRRPTFAHHCGSCRWRRWLRLTGTPHRCAADLDLAAGPGPGDGAAHARLRLEDPEHGKASRRGR